MTLGNVLGGCVRMTKESFASSRGGGDDERVQHTHTLESTRKEHEEYNDQVCVCVTHIRTRLKTLLLFFFS